MQIMEHVLAAFGRAGCSPALAAVLHRVYGDFSLAWAGMDSAFETLDGQAWTRDYPAADPIAFPAIARRVAHMARLDGTTVFLAALEILLDGLAARIAAEAANRGPDAGRIAAPQSRPAPEVVALRAVLGVCDHA
ncbi:hypothetical protein ACWEO6_20625 [Streptomyces sp. NPDC004291]